MKLYHYTSYDTAIRKILPYGILKFNSVAKVNDVVENLYHISDSIDSIFDEDIFDVVRARKIQKEWQLLCFSTDTDSSSGYEMQRMWAQYGGRNTGVCLEIDLEKLKKANDKTIAAYSIHDNKVDYNNSLKTLPKPLIGKAVGVSEEPVDFYDVNMNEIQIKDRFYTKNPDWIGESEYRFVANTREDVSFYLRDSLEKIYLGPAFSKHYISAILQYVPKENVKGLKVGLYGNLIDEILP